MPLEHLNKWASNNEITKAIFEHFRNVLTAGAVGAAGVWLTEHGSVRSFSGGINYIGGFALFALSFGLVYIAMTNAQVRLYNAGYTGKKMKWAAMAYGAFIAGGLITVALTR